jgi:antirestriction protein ArdC
VLREDNRAIIRAASKASKGADYILAFLPGNNGRRGEDGDERRVA